MLKGAHSAHTRAGTQASSWWWTSTRSRSPTTTGTRRLRLNGDADIEADDPLLTRYPGAQFVVRVRVRDVFPNCPRYIHRMRLVERSTFVPHAARDTPVPDWKRADWAREVLPRDDPARRDQ
jgi:uncharacterized protein